MNLVNNIKKILFNRLFHHIIFWSIIFTSIVIISRSDDLQMITTPNLIISFLLLPIPVYIHFFLLEKFFTRKKNYIYFFMTLSLIFFFATLFRSLFTEKMQEFNGLLVFNINLTVFIVITTGLKFLKSNFNQKIEIQQQKTIQLKAEMERVKSGINPGFMKKILDQLYLLSLKKSPQVPNLILQFAEMLRHTTEDSRKKEIELSSEIRNIKEYLNLENQLSGHKFQIKTRGNLRKKIIPLLLVSQVEKNLSSVNRATNNPITGEILLTVDKKGISFVMKINNTTNLKSLFLDIDDLKNRIQQHYSDNYSISKKNCEDSVIITLQILQEEFKKNA